MGLFGESNHFLHFETDEGELFSGSLGVVDGVDEFGDLFVDFFELFLEDGDEVEFFVEDAVFDGFLVEEGLGLGGSEHILFDSKDEIK